MESRLAKPSAVPVWLPYMISNGSVSFAGLGIDGIAPSRASENIPAKNPFNHARCSIENGALSGTKGMTVDPDLDSAAGIPFATPNVLTIDWH
jgi:hypothetical protein